MKKKVLNVFLLLLLTTFSISFPFTTEAKFRDIKNSDSVYISLDLGSPSKINLEITSNLCNLRAKAQLNEEALEVSEFIIEGKDTKITAEASIDLKSPRIEIRGKGRLSFNDLLGALNTFKPQPFPLTELNPQGFLDLKFTLAKGSNQDRGKIKLSSASRELKIKNFKAKDIEIKLLGKGNKLIISAFRAKVSEGEINLTGVLNLSNNKGNLNLTANSIDITQTMQELNIKETKPRGKLSFEANLKSVDFFKWENLFGEGKILISEGDICQIGFLEGLGKFLSIPDFENIIFKKAYSDLFFEGREIFFENFQLNAAQMSIEGKGKMTTAGNIDFIVFPQFSQKLIDSSEGLQKYLTVLLGTGTFSVSISGTVKNPVYTPNISIAPALDKIDNIIGIFKDIF